MLSFLALMKRVQHNPVFLVFLMKSTLLTNLDWYIICLCKTVEAFLSEAKQVMKIKGPYAVYYFVNFEWIVIQPLQYVTGHSTAVFL